VGAGETWLELEGQHCFVKEKLSEGVKLTKIARHCSGRDRGHMPDLCGNGASVNSISRPRVTLRVGRGGRPGGLHEAG
jgi:hypothetical protein